MSNSIINNEVIKEWINSSLLFNTIYAIIFFTLSIYLVKIIINFNRLCFHMRKIPGPPSHFLLGHAILVLHLDRFNFIHGTYALIFQMMTSICKLYGKDKICKMWLGFKPFVILFTPEHCQKLLMNSNLTVKADEYRFFKMWLGEGLVTSNNLKWKQRRKMLTPTFHFKIIQDFLPIMNEQCFVLIEKLDKIALCPINQAEKSNYLESHQGVHDILSFITLCTLDVICETAMGIKLNVQEKDNEYVECLHKIASLIFSRVTRPWIWSDLIYKHTPEGRKFIQCLKIMKQFTVKVIKQRREEWIQYLQTQQNKSSNCKDEEKEFREFFIDNKKRLAFLDLLLQQHLKNPNQFTIQDVREEVDTFMFAGHDTTAMAISWTLYLLGRYKNVQDKLYQEIDEILNQKNNNEKKNKRSFSHFFTLEDLKEMKYLDCVLKEVQRIYPTAPFFARKMTEDLKLDEYIIPKDSTVAVFTYAMHRSSENYENPTLFNPDRFLPENLNKRHPYAFIPFSAGARNCIGQTYSKVEQKLLIANIICNFVVEAVEPEDKLVVVGEIVLRSRTGFKMRLFRRTSLDSCLCLTCKKNSKIQNVNNSFFL